jgi:hypothetical protein
MIRRRKARGSFEAQMLALADEMFAEFEELPVLTVIRAINSARSELRQADPTSRPEPATIGALARTRLREQTAPTAPLPAAPARVGSYRALVAIAAGLLAFETLSAGFTNAA